MVHLGQEGEARRHKREVDRSWLEAVQQKGIVMTPIIHSGDNREILKGFADNSIDSIVTDPPYALTQNSRNGSPRNNDPDTPLAKQQGSKASNRF